MKPKMAVLLSGQPRMLNYCAPFIQEALSAFDTDYFCHFWDTLSIRPITECMNLQKNIDENIIYNISNRLYSPKKINVENYEKYSNTVRETFDNFSYNSLGYKEPTLQSFFSYLSQFSSISKTAILLENHIKETGTKYDFVLRCRPDLIIHPNFKNNFIHTYKNSINPDRFEYATMRTLFIRSMTLTNHKEQCGYYTDSQRLFICDFMFGSNAVEDFIELQKELPRRIIARKLMNDPIGPEYVLASVVSQKWATKFFAHPVFQARMIHPKGTDFQTLAGDNSKLTTTIQSKTKISDEEKQFGLEKILDSYMQDLGL